MTVLVLLQRTVLLSGVFSAGIKLRSRDVTVQLSVDPSSVLGLVFLGQSVSNTLSNTGDSLSVQKVTLNCSLTQLLKKGLVVVLTNFNIQTSVRTRYGFIHLREKENFL